VVQQAVEHGADGSHVAEQFTSVFDRPIGGQQCAGALVAAHDNLQQVLGGSLGQLAHAEVVEDEQGHGGERLPLRQALLFQ